MSKDFLSIIVESKQKEVEEAERNISLSDMKAKARNRDVKRPFLENLSNRDTINIIAEINRASPSKGD